MKKYFVKTPKPFHWIFPKRVWELPDNTKTIYLTFDDGPIPEITPWVLNQLETHNAKATFFCIGKNIFENPEIFHNIIDKGHTVGNHTYNHLNGSYTKISHYLEDIEKTKNLITQEFDKRNRSIETENYSIKIRKLEYPENKLEPQKPLFRPPYGRLSSKKAALLHKKGFKIIMWDVLSGDFDPLVTEEKCLENVLKNTGSGSIVIFHDSVKAAKNLRFTLPKILAYYTEKGYSFKAI